MPVELLLLLLAWAATLSLIVVLPWAVIRVAVRLLEANVSESGADHERAQPRRSSDAETVTTMSNEPDDAVELVGAVPQSVSHDENTDGADG